MDAMTEAPPAPEPSRPPRPESLLGHRDFLKLWAGETVSVLGSQISALAIPLVAISTLDATPFEVGLLAAIEMVPFLLVSLHAGAIVDRVRRRPVLIIGDAGRAVALLTIPIAYAFDALTLLQLYIVVLITGVLTVFFDVAYQAYLPALVDRNQIADGNGKLQMSESGAQIAGPGIAGALVQALGAPAAVVTDAASFVVSAAAVVWIRKPEPEIERPAAATEASDAGDAGDAESSMRADIAEGVRYVVNNPYLRAIAACTSSSNLFSSMMFAVFVLYEVRVLGFSPGVIGAVFAVSNIGFLVGAAVCTRITRALGLGRTIVTSIVVGSVGTLLIPLAPHDGAIPWFVAAGVLMSFGQPVYNINQVSFRQAITPHRLQGRMNATMRFLVWGTMPIGSLLGGALGATIGLHPTVWVAALGGLLPILPVTLSPVRSLVSMPDQVDEPEDGEPSTPVVMEVGPAGPVIEVPTDE